MARARSGGNTTAYAVATVLFAMGFVFSLVLAIIFWSSVAKAQQDATMAKDNLNNVKSGQQEDLERLAKLKRVINGNEGSDIEVILTQWKDLVSVDGRSYVGEVEQLKAELAERNLRIAALERQRAEQKTKAAEVRNAKLALGQEYVEARQQDEQKYNALRNDVDKHQRDFQKGLKDIKTGIGTKFDNAQEDIKTMQLELDRIHSDIGDKEAEIKSLKEKLTGRDQKKQLKMDVVPHDGVIESMLTEEELVYIDLGAIGHVQSGLTFEVYGKNELVKINRFKELAPRGKATIEVIDVSEAASTARIVRLVRGAQVLEGDKIYNLVYDKHWVPLFHVFGQFDIDQTGQPTRTDRRRVEAMIRQWRGRIKEELTYEVDYLVLGVEPMVPREPGEGIVDPSVFKRYTEAKQRYEEYQDLINKARELTTPILNQNRFLHLVGQYRR